MNDPRPQNPYGKLYSVEFLGNMVGGRSTQYNNQPIELLKKAAADSIKEAEVGESGPSHMHRGSHLLTFSFFNSCGHLL